MKYEIFLWIGKEDCVKEDPVLEKGRLDNIDDNGNCMCAVVRKIQKQKY